MNFTFPNPEQDKSCLETCEKSGQRACGSDAHIATKNAASRDEGIVPTRAQKIDIVICFNPA